MPADSPHPSTAFDANIRRSVAARARELGGEPRAADIGIAWAAFSTPPGARLFRAHWVDHSGARALTGVCIDDDINTRPLEAIDLLLRRWRETAGGLPDAGVVATACAFLLDADGRHRVLLAPMDDRIETLPEPLRRAVHGPVYLGGDGELPLAYFWLDAHDRPFRVEIGRDRDGRITYQAMTLRGWVDRQGGEAGESP